MKRTSVQVRNDKRRDSKRRSRQPLKPAAVGPRTLLMSGVVVLVLGGVLLSSLETLSAFVNRPITRVRMENQWQRVDAARIRAALAPWMGRGFFSFDVTAVQRELEDLPWVGRVSVARVWPDSVALHLEEELPIARWGDSAVLNQAGQILYPGSTEGLASLPLLEGPKDSQARVTRQYRELSELLFPAGLQLDSLRLSERNSWSMRLNGGTEVNIGREKILQRVKRFVSFYQEAEDLQREAIRGVDLRYDNGVAIDFSKPDLSGVASR